MLGLFRLVPPEPRPDALVRPRLLRRLTGRWQHAVTRLVAGAGLGKTTLLAQAMAENRLAPRGEDRWVAVDPLDVDVDRFARVVATAMAVSEHDRSWQAAHELSVPEPAVVAEAMWQRTPIEVCLVVDDVHLLPAGSPPAVWLDELVAALPANGHVVLSGRPDPPVELPSIEAVRPGQDDRDDTVLVLTEDELRFDTEELRAFAARRGLDPARLDETGGWPAMAELVASVGGRVAGDFLWEEVLGPLGAERRHVLAVLCDLGGADDDLMAAALGAGAGAGPGAPAALEEALQGVPLVGRNPDGWYVPHGLWRTAPGLGLDPGERLALRRRAAEHLTGRERFDDAFRLISEAQLWDAAPRVLRAASIAIHRLAPSQLGRWLGQCPAEVRESTAGCLAGALHLAFTEANRAFEPLEKAVIRCREDDDVDAELTAIAQLGVMADWRQDLDALIGVAARVAELESTGRPRARALAAFSRAMAADLAGDDGEVLGELESIEDGTLDPSWEVAAAFMHGLVRLDHEAPEPVEARVDQLHPQTSGSVRYVLDFLRLLAWWRRGRLDEALACLPPVLDAARATGLPFHIYLAQSYACVAYAQIGDVETAQQCLDESLAAAPHRRPGARSAWTAAALASLRLAEGDEAEAAAVLRRAIDDHGLDAGLGRRAWRHTLPLNYVLLPETRAHWDGLPLQGYLAAARTLAAAVVDVRGEHAGAALRALDLPEPGLIRATLHVRFAAELAVGLTRAGRPDGRSIVDLFGVAGRTAVRDLAEPRPDPAHEPGRPGQSGRPGRPGQPGQPGQSQRPGRPGQTGRPGPPRRPHEPRLRQSPQARAARSLLAAVPAPPRRASYLGVLGPLELRRDGPDGEEVVDPVLRRKRLQALIGFLVAHRRTTRAAIAAALWPDLGERAAGNNLAVTLSRLLRVLEPWRDSGEPSYLVRQDGQAVTLVTGEHLRIDVDAFGAALREAGRSEGEGNPGAVLGHLLTAVDLYRGDLHAELAEGTEGDWFVIEREHYRSRFVRAATRAGQLLVAHGDLERAQVLARRALGVDPWSEEAYGVLIAAALGYGDRSGARRILRRCVAVLHDLGVQPSPTIQQLHRRIQTAE